jgi:hypothetical protein
MPVITQYSRLIPPVVTGFAEPAGIQSFNGPCRTLPDLDPIRLLNILNSVPRACKTGQFNKPGGDEEDDPFYSHTGEWASRAHFDS